MIQELATKDKVSQFTVMDDMHKASSLCSIRLNKAYKNLKLIQWQLTQPYSMKQSPTSKSANEMPCSLDNLWFINILTK
jgi:hypothetical protein